MTVAERRQPMEMEKVSEWRRQYLSSVWMMDGTIFSVSMRTGQATIADMLETQKKGLVSLLNRDV